MRIARYSLISAYSNIATGAGQVKIVGLPVQM